jgi:hypothetical protein
MKEIIQYHDATIIRRDKHKQKVNYYDKLMDSLLLLDDTNQLAPERNELFCDFHKKFHYHQDKHYVLKSRYFALQCNIELIFSYKDIVDCL